MKRVIIIQARMTSTRLPGKVLRMVAGRPMLGQQLRRLKQCTEADEIIVATTTNTEDDPVVDLARSEGVAWFRGSEHDVLGRYTGAALHAKAEVVVRVTADCPLIDPQVTDRLIGELVEHADSYDYVSNVIERTYPKGLDVEVFFLDTLLRLNRMARSPAAREHVTLFIYAEHPDLFLSRSIVDNENNADLRWTVDTANDLALVRALYDALDLGNRILPYRDILAYVREHPKLMEINAVP